MFNNPVFKIVPAFLTLFVTGIEIRRRSQGLLVMLAQAVPLDDFRVNK